MPPEAWPFLAMVATFVVGTFAIRLPVAVALLAASVIGALVGGAGIPLRHLVEGGMGFLDVILIIAAAMVFMRLVQASGMLDTLAHHMIRAFRDRPAVLLVAMMLFTMSAGMITGSSTAAVLTTGAIVAPAFIAMGLSRERTGAVIAVAGILGMIAPPVNIPVMIIGAGVDMPYIGFELPLLALTLPTAVAAVFVMAWPSVRGRSVDLKALPPSYHADHGWLLYAPLAILIVLVVLERALPGIMPPLGMPLAFAIASLAAPLTGRRTKVMATVSEAVNAALPVLAILVGVGMFLQVMTLTGVRGLVVSWLTGLPTGLLLLGVAVSMPLFGAVSAFGSASILGVPFILALLGHNEIIVGATLSLMAGMGDLMPPTALAGLFAAQVVRVQNYTRVLVHCLIPAAGIVAWGIFAIVTSRTWERLLLRWPTAGMAILFGGLVVSLVLMWVVGTGRRRAKEVR